MLRVDRLCGLLICLAGSSQSLANSSPMPIVVEATSADHMLVDLSSDLAGSAQILVSDRPGSDELTCSASNIVGGKLIAEASCRLVLKKAAWMASLRKADGSYQNIPPLQVQWQRVSREEQNTPDNWGGATPINISIWSYQLDGPLPDVTGRTSKTIATIKSSIKIDKNGFVSDCSVLKSSGDGHRDSNTCNGLRQNARFLPAVGSNGIPVETTATVMINYRI